MRLAVTLIGFSLFLVPVSTTGQAQQLTGAQLAEYCKAMPTTASDPAEDWKGMACVTFIDGFTQAHEMVRAIQEGGPHQDFKPLYCAPKEVSIADYQAIFLRYAAANPKAMAEPAENGLFEAFTLAFPCPWLKALANGSHAQ